MINKEHIHRVGDSPLIFHKEHICRFNDPPQSCDCYDKGWADGIADGGIAHKNILKVEKKEAYDKGFNAGKNDTKLISQSMLNDSHKDGYDKGYEAGKYAQIEAENHTAVKIAIQDFVKKVKEELPREIIIDELRTLPQDRDEVHTFNSCLHSCIEAIDRVASEHKLDKTP